MISLEHKAEPYEHKDRVFVVKDSIKSESEAKQGDSNDFKANLIQCLLNNLA